MISQLDWIANVSDKLAGQYIVQRGGCYLQGNTLWVVKLVVNEVTRRM